MKNIMITPLIILAILALLLVSAGCTVQSTPQTTAISPSKNPMQVDSGTITLTDMANRTVEVKNNPQRIIGVGAGALRMIAYLQAADRVVGVDDREQKKYNTSGFGMPSGIDKPYNLANPELSTKPFIGGKTGDPELIAAQNPDVVFYTFTTGKDAQTLQEKSGRPVVALTTGDLGRNKEVFYQSLKLMAKILGKDERAETVTTYIDATIKDLNDRTKNIPADKRPRVYVGGIAYNGAHGFLSTDPGYSPLLMVNGNNVAASVGTNGQMMIDKEKLLEWNPDVIFVDEASYALVTEDLNDPVYQSLTAVKTGRVYGVMPYNWYANNYDTVLADAYYVGKTLYPDQFADVDPAQKADEIYLMLDGKAVYSDMKTLFGGFVPFSTLVK
ncbi:iron ABC transporter substrate-binding protein [Methanoregula sp.]|uniref:iron ABC transporter substrate-binding protein n=1 Tax=Methanoregula sp. TaxID=2052170 RepID=UPI00356502B7